MSGQGQGEGGAQPQGDGAKTQVEALSAFDLSAMGADLADEAQVEDFTVIETEQFDEAETEGGDGEGEGGEGGEGDGGDKKPEAPAAKDAKKAEPAKPKDGDDDGDDKDMPGWVKRRLARAERKHARELEETRAELEALKKGGKADEAKTGDIGPAPVASDFPDFEAYMDAKTEWEAKKTEAAKAKKPDAAKKDDESGDKGKPDHELLDAIEDIKTALDETAPDLWAKVVAAKDLPISRDMALAVADLDHPDAVLQQLLDEPEKARAIASKTPRQQIAALAKLDVAKPAAAQPPKRTSSAPPPIDPLSGKASIAKSYDAMDFNEFEATRRAEEKASSDWW